MSNEKIEKLRAFLWAIPPGEIKNTDELERVLASCWSAFDGADASGMTADKLYDRMKMVHWDPPLLSFRIARHGETVLGSSRAPVHEWTLDLDQGSAHYDKVGHEQVRPQSARVDVRPIVREIVDLVKAGKDDPRLQWAADRSRVTVRVGNIPALGGVKETRQGRRKRFGDELSRQMTLVGWRRCPGPKHVYERATPGAPHT
jgi:hypothetical protein